LNIRNFDLSQYEDYDGDYREFERGARKTSKNPAKKNKQPADGIELAKSGFSMTYVPARYEELFLYEALKPFYDEELIEDVLSQVKGGKEASVYCCKPVRVTDDAPELVAAKVYRPQQFRNLSNDRMYREGREILSESGKTVKRNESRVDRALAKKTKFGEEVRHTSWLMYEYGTLKNLRKAGAAVPEPLAVADNAILMSYYGSAHRAAPTLNEVNLDREEAKRLFDEVIYNIEIMLANRAIHGDLSAYNILYVDGDIVLIDFPQVTNPYNNTNARFIFQRDVVRVCEYFQRQGVQTDAIKLAKDLWKRFLETEPETDLLLDLAPTLK
jgi:RIO kinase 1